MADVAADNPSTEAQPSNEGPAPPIVAFQPRRNRGNIRKRQVAEADDEDDTVVVRNVKQQQGDPLSFSTKTARSDDVTVQYESNKALPSLANDATRYLETETEIDRDARALREKVLAQQAEGAKDDGTYKGLNNYIDYRAGFRREHTISSEKGAGAHGPLRSNMYVRVSARFDYQPDICKDYKETGFCSYGDSCKFLHDRGDYKSGWELEREWDEQQKAKAEALARKGWNPDAEEEEEEEKDDDDLPFACLICRKPWEECSTPVITRCKHYFCETCALKHNMKTGKCAVCLESTNGIFNIAHDIVKKQKKQKK